MRTLILVLVLSLIGSDTFGSSLFNMDYGWQPKPLLAEDNRETQVIDQGLALAIERQVTLIKRAQRNNTSFVSCISMLYKLKKSNLNLTEQLDWYTRLVIKRNWPNIKKVPNWLVAGLVYRSMQYALGRHRKTMTDDSLVLNLARRGKVANPIDLASIKVNPKYSYLYLVYIQHCGLFYNLLFDKKNISQFTAYINTFQTTKDSETIFKQLLSHRSFESESCYRWYCREIKSILDTQYRGGSYQELTDKVKDLKYVELTTIEGGSIRMKKVLLVNYLRDVSGQDAAKRKAAEYERKGRGILKLLPANLNHFGKDFMVLGKLIRQQKVDEFEAAFKKLEKNWQKELDNLRAIDKFMDSYEMQNSAKEIISTLSPIFVTDNESDEVEKFLDKLEKAIR